MEIHHRTAGFAAERADQARHDLERLRRELEDERERLEWARSWWGEHVPRTEDWTADPAAHGAVRQRELSAPWMDPGLLKARSELFAAALDLHRAPLANVPETMRKNLSRGNGDRQGVCPARAAGRGRDRRVEAAVPRRAAPQHAVGAIWRAQRAVLVGDPMLSEPVGTLPFSAQSRLCGHFKVDPALGAPGLQSAQTIADRVATYGTWIQTGEDRVWVGSPLRVYRRCERLMCEVSNTIAYDGLMVYGNTREAGADYELVKSSIWTHVPAVPG